MIESIKYLDPDGGLLHPSDPAVVFESELLRLFFALLVRWVVWYVPLDGLRRQKLPRVKRARLLESGDDPVAPACCLQDPRGSLKRDHAGFGRGGYANDHVRGVADCSCSLVLLTSIAVHPVFRFAKTASTAQHVDYRYPMP